MSPDDLDLDDAIAEAGTPGWLVQRVPGFGDEEQPCEYCQDEPGRYDPVLGSICAKCNTALEGDV